jgi:LysM repeat protein
MGFYIRKSVSVGPIRLNFSKSGVGLSAGVKGARVGVNARGRGYVHAGRYGIYYRQMLPEQTEPGEHDATGAGVGWILILALVAAVVLFAIASSGRSNSPGPTAAPIQTPPNAVTAALPGPREYTIKAGDTLSAIAARIYGSSGNWPEIYEANKNTLKDPNHLQVGTKLIIPKEEK